MNKEQEKLITDNYKLSRYVAKQFIYNSHIKDYDDLVSIANIGLVKAALTYSETKNVKFTTYAVSCCKNEIASNLKKSCAVKRTTEKLQYLHDKLGDSETGSTEVIDYLEIKELETDTYINELNYYLTKLKENVTPYEYELFTSYIGVDSDKGKTRKELAVTYNVSSGTISYYVDKCRKLLRDFRNKEGVLTW